MSLPLVIIAVLLSLIILLFGIVLIKRMISTSSLDEELEEYEALLKERERRGIGMNAPSIPESTVPIPILNQQEAASTVLPMPTDEEISKALSDEELLKDVDSDDLA